MGRTTVTRTVAQGICHRRPVRATVTAGFPRWPINVYTPRVPWEVKPRCGAYPGDVGSLHRGC